MENVNLATLVSIVLGSIGALLGIINTIYLLFKDKVRIKVQAYTSIPLLKNGDLADYYIYGVSVVNVGFLPVTIREVGYLFAGKEGERMPLVFEKQLSDKLPYRLEPRSSITIYATEDEMNGIKQRKCKKVYAKTECRKTFYKRFE